MNDLREPLYVLQYRDLGLSAPWRDYPTASCLDENEARNRLIRFRNNQPRYEWRLIKRSYKVVEEVLKEPESRDPEEVRLLTYFMRKGDSPDEAQRRVDLLMAVKEAQSLEDLKWPLMTVLEDIGFD